MNKRIRSLVTILAVVVTAGCTTQTTSIPPYLALPFAEANLSTVASIRYQNERGQPISEEEFAAQYARTRRFAMTKAYEGSLPDVTLRITSMSVEEERGVLGPSSQGTQRLPASAAVADLSTCAAPTYPQSELRVHHTGTVRMAFLVGVDGYVKKAEIATSSGFPGLDQAAIMSLAKCRFTPAMADGQPQERWSPVNYVWSIR